MDSHYDYDEMQESTHIVDPLCADIHILVFKEK